MHRHALRVLSIVMILLGLPDARGDEQLKVVEGQVRFAGTGVPVVGARVMLPRSA